MPDQPPEFDLRLLPDWMKEEPAGNRYANYEGDSRGDARGDKDGRGRPPRKPGGNRPDNRREGGGRRDGPRGDRPRGDRPRKDGPFSPRQGDSRPDPRRDEPPFPAEITFVPDPGLLEAVVKQIRATAQAFPLFDLAKLFLAKADRHRVRLAAKPGTTLYQLGEDGPISPDKSALSKAAFEAMKGRYYREETVEMEEIRGNFTSVARCRSTGKILGPTSHHTYQVTLRRHYQEHFANRMRFEAFSKEIEVVSDPETIELWKTEAKRKLIYHSLDEAAPQTFQSIEEVDRHFRATHLPGLLREGDSFEAPGQAATQNTDPRTAAAIRSTRDNALRHPMPMMDALRPLLLSSGLIPFRNALRNQMFTAIRPRPFAHGNQPISDEIKGILDTVAAEPGISRATLAEKLIPAELPAETASARKSALAADLHWLTHAGHVIQYHDGTLDIARHAPKQERPKKPRAPRPDAPKRQSPAPPAPTPPDPEPDPVSGEPTPSEPPTSECDPVTGSDTPPDAPDRPPTPPEQSPS
jgi:hypothetical protein